MSTLNLLTKAVAFKDQGGPSNQPQQKHFDWARQQTVTVSSPKSNEEDIPAGGSFTFFSGSVATSTDGTTAFTITRSALDSTRYRFTHSAGTAPAFKPPVALALAGSSLTIAVQPDATALMTIVGVDTWGALAPGDEVFIPGITTGDTASPFNTLNEGAWVVMAIVVAGSVIQVARRADATFEGVSETIAVTDDTQVIAYSPSGVAIGDSLDISAGFSPSVRKTFQVVAVTPTWVEVVSTVGLPLEVAKTPGAAGFVFYTAAKRFSRLETSQEVAIRINGMTDDKLRCAPLDIADTSGPGEFKLHGPIWSLVVVNRSSQTATVTLFSAE